MIMNKWTNVEIEKIKARVLVKVNRRHFEKRPETNGSGGRKSEQKRFQAARNRSRVMAYHTRILGVNVHIWKSFSYGILWINVDINMRHLIKTKCAIYDTKILSTPSKIVGGTLLSYTLRKIRQHACPHAVLKGQHLANWEKIQDQV